MNTTTLGTPEQQQELKRYMRELNSFDWSFEYSDDYSAVKRGHEALAQLHKQQKQIDPTGEIWLQFMPGDCRHTPVVAKEKANG
jgi:hypothetical protein